MATAEDESSSAVERLTYRERDVDDELDDHERRISRLEKAGLVAVGYGVAEQNMIVETIFAFLT